MPKKVVEDKIIEGEKIASLVVSFIKDILVAEHPIKETLVVGPIMDSQIKEIFDCITTSVLNENFVGGLVFGTLNFQCNNVCVVLNNSSDLVKRRDNYIKLYRKYGIAANCHHLDTVQGSIGTLVTYSKEFILW